MNMIILFGQKILLYIGPGMDGGILTAVIGLITTFAMSVIAIVWVPIKRFMDYFKNRFKKS